MYDNNITSLPILQKGLKVFIAKDDTNQKEPFIVSSIKKTPNKLIVGFNEVTSIDEAELLLGSSVFIESEGLPETENNTYYEGELNLLNVVYKNEVLGRVTSCMILPANAVLEIELNNKNKILLPFISAVFGDIDKNKKTIEINSLDFLKPIE